ncbi:hypothetical protein [Nocardia sp. NPDC048505]|uniref:hypothetical protein n=1 Tax=unclassified Nocardia TaxID=2637762 RepID=UPI0034055C15
MSLRLTFAAGIAALGCTALAPLAAAAELAPGLTCAGEGCRNDTGDTYRVEAEVTCWNGISTQVRHVGPRTTELLGFACVPKTDPGTWEPVPPTVGPDGKWEHQPPQWIPGQTTPQSPLGIDYRSAVVDNDPPQTGSGG